MRTILLFAFLVLNLGCASAHVEERYINYVDLYSGKTSSFNVTKQQFSVGDVLVRWTECLSPEVCFDSGDYGFEFYLSGNIDLKKGLEWRSNRFSYSLKETIEISPYGKVSIISAVQEELPMIFLWSSSHGLIAFGTEKSQHSKETMFLLSNSVHGLLKSSSE